MAGLRLPPPFGRHRQLRRELRDSAGRRPGDRSERGGLQLPALGEPGRPGPGQDAGRQLAQEARHRAGSCRWATRWPTLEDAKRKPGLHWRLLGRVGRSARLPPRPRQPGSASCAGLLHLRLHAVSRSHPLLPRPEGASEEHLRVRRGGRRHRRGRRGPDPRHGGLGQPGRRGQADRAGRDRGPPPRGRSSATTTIRR